MSEWKKILLPSFEWKQMPNNPSVLLNIGVVNENELFNVRDFNLHKIFNGKDILINKLPVIVSNTGDIWHEATVYIFYKIIGDGMTISTISSISDGLATFKNYMDKENIDWLDFSGVRMKRPTYRFFGYLKILVQAGEISSSTATRIMKSVIGFYRWLINEEIFKPINPAWLENEMAYGGVNKIGMKVFVNVTTTDLSLKSPKVEYVAGECIVDGSRLRPLPMEEQEYIIDYLKVTKNTEMKLIFIFALVTGARIQTVLTMTSDMILRVCEEPISNEIRIPVGAGTGIDTKLNKQLVIFMPSWFAKKLVTYIKSERALKRRNLASEEYSNYVFLSKTGQPLYEKKSLLPNIAERKRYLVNGQAVRDYLSNQMLPYIRKKYINNFHFKFHDLRATFGMNITDYQIGLVEKGLITLSDARNYVQFRMGHSSAAQTDHYLNYRRRISHESFIRDEYYLKLKMLIDDTSDE